MDGAPLPRSPERMLRVQRQRAHHDQQTDVQQQLHQRAAGLPPALAASDTPPSAAAGMVVTEMKTPVSALDLASVRETTPTRPARTATTTENRLGS
jgi:hypothetical protein